MSNGRGIDIIYTGLKDLLINFITVSIVTLNSLNTISLVNACTSYNYTNCVLLSCLTDKEREEKTLTAIFSARKRITAEIQDLSDRLKNNREAVHRLKEQIEEQEEDFETVLT